jgi:hypothetical protein
MNNDSDNKIILLNGPPRSGKDTVGHLIQAFTGAFSTKFAKAVKDGAHALTGLTDVPHDFFETCKDQPTTVFAGMTPREFYIHYSEVVMKPLFGARVFGLRTAQELAGPFKQGRICVVTDSGFEAEALAVADLFGALRVELWKIYRDGTTFDGDSRSYVMLDNPAVRPRNISNNGTILELAQQVQEALSQ